MTEESEKVKELKVLAIGYSSKEHIILNANELPDEAIVRVDDLNKAILKLMENEEKRTFSWITISKKVEDRPSMVQSIRSQFQEIQILLDQNN